MYRNMVRVQVLMIKSNTEVQSCQRHNLMSQCLFTDMSYFKREEFQILLCDFKLRVKCKFSRSSPSIVTWAEYLELCLLQTVLDVIEKYPFKSSLCGMNSLLLFPAHFSFLPCFLSSSLPFFPSLSFLSYYLNSSRIYL